MRNVNELHPFLQIKLKELQDLCAKNGLKIGISECYRTVKEQNDLYAQGRTKAGSIVTNCKGDSYSSPHQWGIAFDFYRNDGKGAYNDGDNFFTKVGTLAKSIGLESGCFWKSFVDKPHVQLRCYGSTISKIKNTYGSFTTYHETWNYKPKEKVNCKSPKKDILWLQERLALCLNIDLVIDGVYGNNTSNAVKSYWKKLGWNIAEKDKYGYYKAGEKTVNALSNFRVK